MTATEASTKIGAGHSCRGELTAVALSLAASLLIVAPFFWRGSASGHDFEFHLASWLDVAAQWKQGIVFPRWMESANHGFGEPRFIFYPPLSWLLGAALSFVVRWAYVPVAFVVLVQTFAGWSAFVLARRTLADNAATFAALCYVTNPNALLIVYMRSDFAELLASAFFPLFFLGALEISDVLESRAGSYSRGLVLFSSAFAAVWLANAPAGVLATYSAAVLFVWTALQQRSCGPLRRGLLGMALGFGLCAFYLLPAAYEQRWVSIAQALSSGLLPAQNFLYTIINDPEHNFFNWIASTCAIVLIVFTGTGAVLAHREQRRQATANTGAALWSAFFLMACFATVLMFAWSGVAWQVLPKLRFVQFPWRWMSILAVPFAYFSGSVLRLKRVGLVYAVLMASVLAGIGVFLVQQTWWDDEDVPILHAALEKGVGFDGTDEYDPLGDDHYNLPAKAPKAQILAEDDSSEAATDARVEIERWTSTQKTLRVKSSAPARVALRVLNYPAWRVEVDGKGVEPGKADDNGQMIVDVPAGESEVRVQFMMTPDRTLGDAVSLLTLLTVATMFWKARLGKLPYRAST